MKSFLSLLSSRLFLSVVGGVGAAVLLLGTLYLYGKNGVARGSEDSFTAVSATIFRFPLAEVNGRSIPYARYLSEKKSLARFYETREEPVTHEEIALQVVSRLLIQQVIEDVAERYDVSLLADDVKAAETELLSQFPDDRSAKKVIRDHFGWTIGAYVDTVIQPLLLEDRLADFFRFSSDEIARTYQTTEVDVEHLLFVVSNEKERAGVQKNALLALKRAKTGEPLEAISKTIEEGVITEVGGLGWMTKNTIPPGLEPFGDIVFGLEKGETADGLIETTFGFHVARVLERRRVGDFGAFMDATLQNATVTMHANVPHPFQN